MPVPTDRTRTRYTAPVTRRATPSYDAQAVELAQEC